jgi:GNAT superfamily N-acetyltransferase
LKFDVRIAESAMDLAGVRQLWREYWESFGLPADFQGFSDEVQGLPGVYGAAGGALLIARHGESACATIALRRFSDRAGEMKRLFVRPEFRGHRLAGRLLDEVIERSRAFGYQALYCDTLPMMTEALAMYERRGFERIQAYYDGAPARVIFLKLQLV